MYKNNSKRITAYLLAFLLSFSVICSTPVLQAHASTESAAVAGSLIGTGASDEINILRILDMALNKSGIVMSSGTIRTFLEYWWSSVKSDVQTLVKDADTTITTVSDYIAWVEANHDSVTVKNYQTALRFLKFCATMEVKTLSDFKQLITQEGTFRKFLLSYVADSEGNTAGSVSNNKLAKYNLKSGLITMVRQAADSYIEEHEGYYIVPTNTYKDLSPSMFRLKEDYDAVVATLKSMPDDGIFFYGHDSYTNYFIEGTPYNFVGRISSTNNFTLNMYDDSWNLIPFYQETFSSTDPVPINLEQFNGSSFIYSRDLTVWSSDNFDYLKNFAKSWYFAFTQDGHAIKIWKTLDGFKASSVGKSDIYYSKDYSDFEESKDTGLTFTGSYYNGSYSHDTVQNTIDNSQTTVDNSVVNNIVNNYITNNYGDGSGSGGTTGGDNSSGSGSGSWWDIGSGIEAFFKGIASLLDFLLKLIGGVVDLLGTFLTSVLDVLSGLASVGQGFSDFLAESFKFLPQECINLIFASIAAMCIAGVIKAFIK